MKLTQLIFGLIFIFPIFCLPTGDYLEHHLKIENVPFSVTTKVIESCRFVNGHRTCDVQEIGIEPVTEKCHFVNGVRTCEN